MTENNVIINMKKLHLNIAKSEVFLKVIIITFNSSMQDLLYAAAEKSIFEIYFSNRLNETHVFIKYLQFFNADLIIC